MLEESSREGIRVARVITALVSIDEFRDSPKVLATSTVEETAEFLANEVLSDQTEHARCLKLVEAVDPRALVLFSERLLEACPVHFDVSLLAQIGEKGIGQPTGPATSCEFRSEESGDSQRFYQTIARSTRSCIRRSRTSCTKTG